VEYAAYSVDTDVVEIMAYEADTTQFGNQNGSTNPTSHLIVFLIKNGFNFLKSKGTKYLLRGNKRD
jgi:hypothetical protein